MPYELAKELKDAGFPQHGEMKGHDVLYIRNDETQEKVYIPTLQELIEACGKKFEMLIKDIHPLVGKEVWRAHSPSNMERGATPTEAVARLWLALNNKKHE